MNPLEQQMREYQDIQEWLAGKKPPARGRTWRRRLREALPAPVQRMVLATASCGSALLLRTLFVVVMAQGSYLLEAFIDPAGTPGQLPLESAIRFLFDTLRPIVTYVSAAFLVFVSVALCLGSQE